MSKYVSIHFSTKESGFSDKLKAAIVNLRHAYDEDIILVHAFASREFLNQKNISTEVLDFLDKFFPKQVNFFSTVLNTPMRKEMFEYMANKRGDVHFLGDPDEFPEGVKEELQIAENVGFSINYDTLEEYHECVSTVFFC